MMSPARTLRAVGSWRFQKSLSARTFRIPEASERRGRTGVVRGSSGRRHTLPVPFMALPPAPASSPPSIPPDQPQAQECDILLLGHPLLLYFLVPTGVGDPNTHLPRRSCLISRLAWEVVN